MKFLKELKRSHLCGQLNASVVGQKVTLMGWVASRRDHGSLVFLDLRDREGVVQVVINPGLPQCASAKDVRMEYVVALQGLVKARPEGMRNAKIPTGEIEVEVLSFEILNESAPLPFASDDESVSETLRLKYRYLDLRSPRLQRNLITRHRVTQFVRHFLSERRFLEVETPILYKSTPEGARDYLVPSRVNQGSFYALPQSPQTLKQLLMISGFDRYFQIARCFRDEDLRADRQPEFSQIDIEMSFIDQEDIMQVNEELLRAIWKEFRGVEIEKLPRMSYQKVMDLYGSDKPDLRFGMEIQDLSSLFAETRFQVFQDVLARKGFVRALVAPGAASYSRGQIDKLTDLAKKSGAKGLVWIKWDSAGALSSSVSKFFSEAELRRCAEHAKAQPGDLILIVADDFDPLCSALNTLRQHLGRELNLIDESKDRFLWVIDFPLFEYSPEERRWVARHHPFTSPLDEHAEWMLQKREERYPELLAKAYDLVCNGYEVAGGSVRIFRNELQQAMFETLGFSQEDIQRKFGFFIEALKYGTPPHGGIAWGMDRLVMILCGTDAIREVIAFPKTARATDLMSGAPTHVQREQLAELGIRLAASVAQPEGAPGPSSSF
jgi:aspartyl-tRNA synthetase